VKPVTDRRRRQVAPELDVEAIERDLRDLEQHEVTLTDRMVEAGISHEQARRAHEMRLRDARRQLEIAKRYVGPARLKGDYRAAEAIVAWRQALNAVIRAQKKLVEVDADLASALFGAILAEEKVTMTPQQFFLALAARYATNVQLARVLYGRADKRTLNRVHVALYALRGISDEDWAWMDRRARPVPHRTVTP
jgi:hypothetical protein